MSAKVFRSISDFVERDCWIDVECDCGHTNTLEPHRVYRWFEAKRKNGSLSGAIWCPSAHAYFRCTRCGKRGAKHIGPIGR